MLFYVVMFYVVLCCFMLFYVVGCIGCVGCVGGEKILTFLPGYLFNEQG